MDGTTAVSNVALRLPIIRTSVNHGTAFDIPGSGKAQSISLLEAIDYALKLVDTSTVTQGPNSLSGAN